MAQFIEQQANELFKKLKREAFLQNTAASEMPLRLAYYLSELNAIHPFREGNGRTQRIFIEYLAKHNGYSVDFSNVSNDEMIEASALAFQCDYSKMNDLMCRITNPELTQEF